MLMQSKTIDLYQYFLYSKKLLKKLFSPNFSLFWSLTIYFAKTKGVFGKISMSTLSLLVSVTEEIRKNIDEGVKICSVFLDLAKAFDTVKHNILIQKLESYGRRRQAAKLLRSYLSERNQFVQIRQTISSTLKTHFGVPQGSVLGPLSFLVYINDLPRHLINEKSFMTLFADDTSLICSDRWIANWKQMYIGWYTID